MKDWIKAIYNYYGARGLVWPTTQQAVLWLATEFGEVCDIALAREEQKWVRNHPENVIPYTDERFGEELGDVIMMAIVAGMTRGVNPLELLEAKMEQKLKEGGK